MRTFFITFSIAWLLTGCSEPVETFKEVTRPIEWTQVQQSSFDQVRRLSGTLYPVEATNLSFEVGGKVEWVKANLGDEVKQGDALAQLDRRSFNLSRQSAKANLQKAYAVLSETKNEFQRYSKLSKKGLASQSAYDSTKAALNQQQVLST